MKTCTKCGESYADELSFCLQDGTPLPARSTAGFSNAPTEAFRPGANPAEDISAAETIRNTPFNTAPARPTQFQLRATGPANKMGCVVTVGSISAVMLVALGLSSYMFLSRDSSLVATSNRPAPGPGFPVNANATGNYPAIPSDSANVPTLPPKATPAPTNSSRTISGGVLNGKATSLPKPAYPPAARAVRASGSVSVQVLVDEQGNVVSANAVSGHPLLREAAAAAARGAKFEPTVLSGKPVKVSGVLTYSFVPE